MQRISVLGGVATWRDGRAHPLPGRVLPLVLAVLASRANHSVRTEALVDALRPDDARRGRAALQVHVNRLRDALDDPRPSTMLLTVPGGYRLVAAADELDLLRFETLAASGLDAARDGKHELAAQSLDAALQVWAEPFGELGAHPLLVAAHERLTEQRRLVEESLADAWLALGHETDALELLTRLTEEEPLREGRWMSRMLALYRTGRQAEALRCYQRVRQLLDDELGVEPSPGLRELEAAILVHDPRLQRASRPAAATHTADQ